jgi:hypothetical protein
MISETNFASHFTSVWKGLAPTSELFVRKINSRLYEREFPRMASSVAPARRALVNETAFRFFVRCGARVFPVLPPDLPPEQIYASMLEARTFVAQLDKANINQIHELNAIEKSESLDQATRLCGFFSRISRGKTITYYPAFRGCGVVDSCQGDVLVGNKLYEVKAGDRNFRSPDIRQLLVYAALDFEAKSSTFEVVGLFNPRSGISVEMQLDDLCFEVSGKASSDLLADIVRAISSGEMSR